MFMSIPAKVIIHFRQMHPADEVVHVFNLALKLVAFICHGLKHPGQLIILILHLLQRCTDCDIEPALFVCFLQPPLCKIGLQKTH